MPRRVEENLQQPKLQPVMVPADKLLLWPNNPRLFVGEDLNVPEEKFAEPGVQQRAFSQMAPSGDPFRLEELKGSFRRNGFVPVDYIFVRRHLSSGAYLVLEGNRRVSAIRQLLDEERLPAKDRKRPPLSEAVRKSLEVVECMEVVNQLPDDELTDMITYLLGVRHHGALKQWSAFAKAAHMYELYLEGIGGDSTAFRWDGVVAESVAKGLCVELKEVREGVATYRVMEDIARRESVKACDGIQDRD